MKVLGLTGGVGMGKTTTASILSRLDARIIDTDDLARQLVLPGQPALFEILSAFGAGMLASDGHLRRDHLARLVFTDASARQKLESILHPRIRHAWLEQMEKWRHEGVKLAVVTIPLLFETQAESHFDRIICVACSPFSQRERLVARGWQPDHIQQRLAAQWPTEQKMARSHYVIWTEGCLENSSRQASLIIQRL